MHCIVEPADLFRKLQVFDTMFWTAEMNACDLFASKGKLVHRKTRRQARAGHKGTANELEKSNNRIVYLLQI